MTKPNPDFVARFQQLVLDVATGAQKLDARKVWVTAELENEDGKRVYTCEMVFHETPQQQVLIPRSMIDGSGGGGNDDKGGNGGEKWH